MLEKGMQQTWKVLQKGANMGTKIKKKSIKIGVQKSIRKKDAIMQRPGGRRVGRDATSNVLTSQDVSSSSCKRLKVHTLRFLTPLRYTHRPETSPDVNLKGSALPADPKIETNEKYEKI